MAEPPSRRTLLGTPFLHPFLTVLRPGAAGGSPWEVLEGPLCQWPLRPPTACGTHHGGGPRTREAEAIRDDLTALLPDPVLSFSHRTKLPALPRRGSPSGGHRRPRSAWPARSGAVRSTLVVASAAALVKKDFLPPIFFPRCAKA
ncbi:MAG: hypothetical protein MZV70_33345 [Desulfobacterales bacterium]|nr:hypothetical protein [Desulfobacterales bacterium]